MKILKYNIFIQYERFFKEKILFYENNYHVHNICYTKNNFIVNYESLFESLFIVCQI